MATKQLKNGGHPLAEIFGYKVDDFSLAANKFRNEKLCPFNNSSQKCTKDKKDRPLGVCTMFAEEPTIICPVRFREEWLFYKDASAFFFPKGSTWTDLREISLPERSGKSAGKIDVVLVRHDDEGRIEDFGAIEVQAVYVSGNIRRPFEKYMEDPKKNCRMDWSEESNYPGPDFLSSSRKRLAPQLLYKGQILKAWNKKQAVVVDRPFFASLPDLPKCKVTEADLCWLVYKLDDAPKLSRYKLQLDKKVFSGFDPTMETLGTPDIGELSNFVEDLENKLAAVRNDLKARYNVSSMSEYLDKHNSQESAPDLTI